MIKIQNTAFEKPLGLLLMKDQRVIVSRSPENAHTQRSLTRPEMAFEAPECLPPAVATRAKPDPNFLSLSRIRYVGVCSYGVASHIGTHHRDLEALIERGRLKGVGQKRARRCVVP